MREPSCGSHRGWTASKPWRESAAQVWGDVRVVLGVPTGGFLRVDQLTFKFDLEDTPRTGDQSHVVLLAELLEDLLCRAHGTTGVVSGPTELDGHIGHVRIVRRLGHDRKTPHATRHTPLAPRRSATRSMCRASVERGA